MESLSQRKDVAISELILFELYTLLRNPVILQKPMTAFDAVETIQAYRNHPYWHLIGFDVDSRSLHDEIWKKASSNGFARRRIYDLRFALYLQRQGVKEFATVNTKDFMDLNFTKVWNPLK